MDSSIEIPPIDRRRYTRTRSVWGIFFVFVLFVSFSLGRVNGGEVSPLCGGENEWCCFTYYNVTGVCPEASFPPGSDIGDCYCDPENSSDEPLLCDTSTTSPNFRKCVVCSAGEGDTCCPGSVCNSGLTCNTITNRCEEICGQLDGQLCCSIGGEEGEGTDYYCDADGLICDEDSVPPVCRNEDGCGSVNEPCCDRAYDLYCEPGLTCIDWVTTPYCSSPCDEVNESCCIDEDTGERYCLGSLSCNPWYEGDFICLMLDEDTDPDDGEECGLENASCCIYSGDDPDQVPVGDDNQDGCVYDLLPTWWSTGTSSGCTCQDPEDCGGDWEVCCYTTAYPIVSLPCDNAESGCLGGVCIPGYDYLNNFTSYGGYVIPDITSLLAPIFKILFYAGIAVGILAIILSGYLLMSSEGDPNKVKEAKEQFSASIFGIMFILLSLFLLRVIINNILGADLGF